MVIVAWWHCLVLWLGFTDSQFVLYTCYICSIRNILKWHYTTLNQDSNLLLYSITLKVSIKKLWPFHYATHTISVYQVYQNGCTEENPENIIHNIEILARYIKPDKFNLNSDLPCYQFSQKCLHMWWELFWINLILHNNFSLFFRMTSAIDLLACFHGTTYSSL